MKIYIVHENAVPDDKYFNDLTDEEIEKMYEEDCDWVDRYDDMLHLEACWNNDEILYPCSSYMRVIND